jgi:DNA-binding response OmpR family regulator
MMPDMDGPSTLLALRALDKGGDVPVIFLTAKAQVAEVAGFKSLGALDVMSKPFDGMTLAKQVQAIWDQQAE